MYKNLRWKFLIIGAVIAIAAYAVIPPSQKIKLGLDLKGGVHLVMQVKTDDALKIETDTNAEQLQEALKTASPAVPFTSVRVTSITEFQVDGVPAASEQQFRQIAQSMTGTSFDREPGTEGSSTFRMKPNIARDRRTEAVKQALLTIEKRVNEFGVSEPVVAPYGTTGDQIVVQLPGVTDVARAKKIIRNTARLEIKLVEGEAPDEQTLLAAHGGKVPDDMEKVTGAGGREGASIYLVRKVAAITGSDLSNAKVTQDELGLPAVGFTLKSGGVTKFSKVTGENVGRQLAIILDGVVQSAPRIESRIAQPDARITGTFTPAEAQDLALVLKSGALPASLTYQEQREVGATLGQDSVRAGVLASLVGLALVTLFMLTYYKLAGINAFVSITLNLLILLAFMSYLGAVMTLPGVAGLVLTIGMGVDSNVLIFERIREELALKKGARQAVAAGFDRVFITIIDTHVSSLISAAFLFQFGTGPIRGFATTLFFGLITNVFTAVFVSRSLFEFVLSRRPAGSAQQVSI